MPNWCANRLKVSGSYEAMTKFREWLGDEPLTLQRIKPMPDELTETVVWDTDEMTEAKQELVNRYGAHNWYEWRIKNWGTKWDVAEIEQSEENGALVFDYQTAWAPPLDAIRELAVKFPDLTIYTTYHEYGCEFTGEMTISGEDFDEKYYDSQNSRQEYIEYVKENWDGHTDF